MSTAISDDLAEEIAFLVFLRDECGYVDAKPITSDPTHGFRRLACIMGLMFTHAIITVKVGDRFGYLDRWCFHSYDAAKKALDAWDGTGEPSGWHRHPVTGRRRPEGDPAKEYVEA